MTSAVRGDIAQHDRAERDRGVRADGDSGGDDGPRASPSGTRYEARLGDLGL
ncbi:hypothetical protein [Streptomyces sp. NPDC006971]|uniref:hypothetical protein n=1 Tax=Streptomyces sp. NPDC006971 TaxID=3154784 RepID=UPI0033D646A6